MQELNFTPGKSEEFSETDLKEIKKIEDMRKTYKEIPEHLQLQDILAQEGIAGQCANCEATIMFGDAVLPYGNELYCTNCREFITAIIIERKPAQALAQAKYTEEKAAQRIADSEQEKKYVPNVRKSVLKQQKQLEKEERYIKGPEMSQTVDAPVKTYTREQLIEKQGLAGLMGKR